MLRMGFAIYVRHPKEYYSGIDACLAATIATIAKRLAGLFCWSARRHRLQTSQDRAKPLRWGTSR
eukprot:7159973-Lingulodinium_polyedra.AAC.1